MDTSSLAVIEDIPDIGMIDVYYDLPFGVPTPDGSIFTKIDNDSARIVIEVKRKEMKSTANESLFATKLEFSSSMRLAIDRFGKYHYTTIKVTFRINPAKPSRDLPEEHFIQKAIIVTNRLLDACRMASDRYCPRNIIRLDIGGYRVEYFHKSGEKVFEIGGTGSIYNTISNANMLNAQELSQLETLLRNDVRMPIQQELITNANDFLLFGNYRMACIEIQSAVESIIGKIIMNHLINRGKSATEIEDVLKKRLDDLKPHLSEISNSITTGSEWGNWKSKCHNVRNEVVHKGKWPDEREARDAVSYGLQFIKYLEQFMPKS